MAFSAQAFYSILDVSVHWGFRLTQVVNNAIADELDLVTVVSDVMRGEKCVAGLISVLGFAVRPLFRPFGNGAKKTYLTEACLTPNEPWRMITKPARGVRLTAADIIITAKEIDRFDEDHGIGRTLTVGPGALLKYDWDGFYIAVLKRIYSNDFPARQCGLVVEMQEWFIVNSAEGDAPDESTIGRRIQTVWKELNLA